MGKDTCNRCVHCTHIATDEMNYDYFFCEIDNEYISQEFALDETMSCDAYVENLDDNETEKQ